MTLCSDLPYLLIYTSLEQREGELTRHAGRRRQGGGGGEGGPLINTAPSRCTPAQIIGGEGDGRHVFFRKNVCISARTGEAQHERTTFILTRLNNQQNAPGTKKILGKNVPVCRASRFI